MSSTQHRCVFVGNIPYDATEEELIRICEEVGPVVSFRLVVDRETGKPKGYGFCEYRDEETALSARRNLQGYEINGRLLRVDFAENEKGSGDRNRDQKGRGGPGLVDLSKQQGGPKGARDPTLFQPIGLPASMSAAAVMANLLGGPQVPPGSMGGPGGGRLPMGIDALTLNLANMSRFQLWEVLNQMKSFIQQNQQQARQVLTQNTQLVKALFQAQIILGCIPQVSLQPLQAQGIQHHPPAMPPQQQGMPPQQGQVHIPNGGQLQQQGLQQLSQPQRLPNFQFQPSPHLQQQPNAWSAPMILPPQPLAPPLPTSLGLPPLNFAMQRPQTQLLPHLNPPPLPHQARPLLPPSPPRGVQVAGFQPNPSQQAQLQQMPTNMPYPPPLPNQRPPQVLQVPQTVGEMGGNAGLAQLGISSTAALLIPTSAAGLSLPTSGGVAQYGSSMPTTAGLVLPISGGATRYSSMPATSAAFTNWSSIPPAAGPAVGAPPMTLAMPVASLPMAFGQSSTNSNQQGVVQQGPGVSHSAEYVSQPHTTMQPPEYGQPAVMQLPGQQVVSQVALEPEQQKVLLQQVMNLTPEQVNSLPPEQRQQVLDLQQAFRNQII